MMVLYVDAVCWIRLFITQVSLYFSVKEGINLCVKQMETRLQKLQVKYFYAFLPCELWLRILK